MPVSKHRKKNGKRPVRKNKSCLESIFLPKEKIDKVRSVFTKAELIVEMKLPRGECVFDDVAQIRDVLNFCAWVSVYKSRIAQDLNDEWIEVNFPYFMKAQDAFHEFYGRGNAKGGIDDPSVRYVATGEELTAIRDGVVVAGDLCQQMLDKNPITFVKLFFAMKQFLKGKGSGRLEFEGDSLAKEMQRIKG